MLQHYLRMIMHKKHHVLQNMQVLEDNIPQDVHLVTTLCLSTAVSVAQSAG